MENKTAMPWDVDAVFKILLFSIEGTLLLPEILLCDTCGCYTTA